jgi:hypothetical protein
LDENRLLGRQLAPFSKKIIAILQEKYGQQEEMVYGKKFL